MRDVGQDGIDSVSLVHKLSMDTVKDSQVSGRGKERKEGSMEKGSRGGGRGKGRGEREVYSKGRVEDVMKLTVCTYTYLHLFPLFPFLPPSPLSLSLSPDNWPWGYIITPNPEGNTEVASENKGKHCVLQ